MKVSALKVIYQYIEMCIPVLFTELRNYFCYVAAQPLINERLSFMSEFSILNGIPSFLLKSSLGSNTATCSRFSSNGSFLVVGYDDGYVRIWDADNGILVREQLLHESPVSDVEFQVNNGLFACQLS